MSKDIHLVFGLGSPAVSDEEFNRWYRVHLSEILVVPGWLAARRYSLRRIGEPRSPATFPYLAAYEFGPDIAANIAALDEGVAERRAAGPSWVAENRYVSWNCTPLEPQEDFDLPEHLVLEFSAPPAGVPVIEFGAWHLDRLKERLDDGSAMRAWRFRLDPRMADEESTLPSPTHLGVYQVQPGARTETWTHEEVAGPSGAQRPPWRAEVRFSTIDAEAITARVVD